MLDSLVDTHKQNALEKAEEAEEHESETQKRTMTILSWLRVLD